MQEYLLITLSGFLESKKGNNVYAFVGDEHKKKRALINLLKTALEKYISFVDDDKIFDKNNIGLLDLKNKSKDFKKSKVCVCENKANKYNVNFKIPTLIIMSKNLYIDDANCAYVKNEFYNKIITIPFESDKILDNFNHEKIHGLKKYFINKLFFHNKKYKNIKIICPKKIKNSLNKYLIVCETSKFYFKCLIENKNKKYGIDINIVYEMFVSWYKSKYDGCLPTKEFLLDFIYIKKNYNAEKNKLMHHDIKPPTKNDEIKMFIKFDRLK